MTEFAKEVIPVHLEDEMRQSYLDYAMSVIVGRALPDVRDGLKPVHRRVLYAMDQLGNHYNKSYKKSARVVGDVIGKYHPHGDTAVYDTIVRMAQPFSMRHMLIDGQGNFGSVDGDAPAAMRYTEVRMSRIANELLDELDQETVDFIPNYDETELEPVVFPARYPNLLVNGSSGIAVGMATNMPPHNLGEVINALVSMIEKPGMTLEEITALIPGPDFPTGAIINGSEGIREAYATGRGRIRIRARVHTEDIDHGRHALIITELPYQVNKARLVEKIADLVKGKHLEGISELRDESDKDGMRVVIELRRGEVPEVVLNNLYQQTAMENVFGINMMALENGRPRLFDLPGVLNAFLNHRCEVVTRRSQYALAKARQRLHVLQGYAAALANIDEIIDLIRTSADPASARRGLVSQPWSASEVLAMIERAQQDNAVQAGEAGLKDNLYYLSEIQAQAILDLRLHRLTALEQGKIRDEAGTLLARIGELNVILGSHDRLLAVIKEELIQIKAAFANERRSEIVRRIDHLQAEDLIEEQPMVVTLSRHGYVKAQPLSDYREQRRGGQGKNALRLKDEDLIDRLFMASSRDGLLCLSSKGRAYWLKVYQLPQGSRGKPAVNLLPFEGDERIITVMPISELVESTYLFMVTEKGIVKKTLLNEFSRPRSSGIIALDLKENDQLFDVYPTDGQKEIVLLTNAGKSIRFSESDVRPMGRIAAGVRGVRLAAEQRVIGLVIVDENSDILIATARGYGKRTALEEFPLQGRGGQGVIAIKTSLRNGSAIGAVRVSEGDQAMLISSNGKIVRISTGEVSRQGRNTQGVRLIDVGKNNNVAGLCRVEDASL